MISLLTSALLDEKDAKTVQFVSHQQIVVGGKNWIVFRSLSPNTENINCQT